MSDQTHTYMPFPSDNNMDESNEDDCIHVETASAPIYTVEDSIQETNYNEVKTVK